MKVVFLDFDGVVNSAEFFARESKADPGRDLDRDAVACVTRILEATGAVVVISSTWRIFHKLDELREILSAHGFRGEIIGKTPTHGYKPGSSEELWMPYIARGYEIQAWIDTQETPPEAFVILDDDDDMVHLQDRLVLTSWETGLLDEHVAAAIAMLGTKQEEP